MIRPATLWIALVLSLPAFYQVLVTQQLEVEEAIIRFLLAVPVAMLMLWILRFITAGYGRRKDSAHPLRRRDDQSGGPPPTTTADAP